MASQIAHIIYAQKYLKKHPMANGDEDMFMLGCVFPDIRRIDDTIKRKDTHLRYETCDLNFEGLTPFQAGWKFHLYCDMKREEILNKYDFYSISGAADFWNTANKLLEDELIYESYNNWEKLVGYLNNVPKIETGINISRETFELWYAINAKYIERKPDNKSIHIILTKMPSLTAKADEIVKTIDKLRKSGKVVKILERVKDEII